MKTHEQCFSLNYFVRPPKSQLMLRD